MMISLIRRSDFPIRGMVAMIAIAMATATVRGGGENRIRNGVAG